MKISQSSEKGINILTVLGPLGPKDTAILRAGITHFLKHGRNRLVVEFKDIANLSQDILRCLTELEILARELSGRIVFTSDHEGVQRQMLSFSTPTILECHRDRFNALSVFSMVNWSENLQPPSDQELAALRMQVQELQATNLLLMKQVRDLVLERRSPPDEDAYRKRIADLEQKLSDAISS